MTLAYEKPDVLLSILDEKARTTAERLGIDLEEPLKYDFLPKDNPVYRHDVLKLMHFAGTLPHSDIEQHPQPILVNILEGVRWGEFLYTELLKDIV